MRSRVNQKDCINNNRDATTEQRTRAHNTWMFLSLILKAACYKLINTVLRAPLFLLALHHVLVHFLCIVLSVERLWRQDFGQINGDPSKSNLKSAIMIFYSLALAQGVQYLIWYILKFAGNALVNLVAKECEFDSEWGVHYVHKYLMVTEFKYLKDLSSNQGWDLRRHAKDLLDSDSEEDFLCGARMLATFIEKGELSVQELRLSRRKIQRLLMVLACTDPDDWEMRFLAAKIMGHIARDISLSEFPGMSQCISSLLNPFEPCPPLCLAVPRPGNKKAEGNENYRKECQLIQQGLVILERLANGEQNCMAICRAEGLVRSIKTLMFSTLLIDAKKVEWVNIQRAAFSSVARIISVPGETTAEICQEIANKFEASMILRSENCPKIQILAINILTKTFMLVMDTDDKRDAFLEVILRLFLSCQENRNGRTSNPEVQEKAGEALATLLMASESCCLAILRIQPDIVTVVDEILHSQTRIVYRIIAAEILQHLCFHRAVRCTKEMFSKVLQLLVRSSEERTQTGGGGIQIQVQGDNSQVDEQYHDSRLQATLLTFIAVIHVEKLLVKPEIFSLSGDFMQLLKDMVDRNSSACTFDGLQIVKATVALVESLKHNVQDHVEVGIIDSLSKATENMSDFEKWMIFQNTTRHHVVQNHLWL